MAPPPVIRLHPEDNVVIARATLLPGAPVGDNVLATQRIPAGHKVAVRAIAPGEPVRRYGQIIGFASAAIAPGQHVHVAQLRDGRFRQGLRLWHRRPPHRVLRTGRHLPGHPPPRRQGRHAQLHRHPDQRELFGPRRRRGRRHVPPQPVHRRRPAGRFPQRRRRRRADPQDRLRHDPGRAAAAAAPHPRRLRPPPQFFSRHRARAWAAR